MCSVGGRARLDLILLSYLPSLLFGESSSSTVFSVVVRFEISKKSFRLSPLCQGEKRKDFLYALPNRVLISAKPFFHLVVWQSCLAIGGMGWLFMAKQARSQGEDGLFHLIVSFYRRFTLYASIIFLSLPESRKRITAAAPLMKTKSMKKSNRFSMG